MLVLSRHRDEKIYIGGHTVVITVVEIRGDKVRLGIEADPDITVHRGEIQEILDREQQQSEAAKESEVSAAKSA